nr:E3 ubiquitin-protein ligase PUB23 [Ipomoea trifida]
MLEFSWSRRSFYKVFVGISFGWPSGFGNDQFDVVVLQRCHGRENGVNLGVEEVEVTEVVSGVHDAGILPEECVIERNDIGVGLVGEERVTVDYHVRPGLAEEVQQGFHHGLTDSTNSGQNEPAEEGYEFCNALSAMGEETLISPWKF